MCRNFYKFYALPVCVFFKCKWWEVRGIANQKAGYKAQGGGEGWSVKLSTCICANPGKELKVSTQLNSRVFLCYFLHRFPPCFFYFFFFFFVSRKSIENFRAEISFCSKKMLEHVKGGA